MTTLTLSLPDDDTLILDRTPWDSSCATTSYDGAYLRIEGGAVSLETRTYYGGDGTPIDEWHRRVLTYPIANARNGAAAIDVARLRDDFGDGGKLSPLLARIIAGHSVEWDGNNMTGTLTQDARQADDEMQRILEDGRYVSDKEVWDAEAWLTGNGSQSAAEVLRTLDLDQDSTDDDVKTTAAAIESEAESNGCLISGDMAAVLRGMRDNLKEDNGEDDDEE